MIQFAAVKALFAASALWKYLGIIMLVTAFFVGMLLVVTKTYNSIYDRGHLAGTQQQLLIRQTELLKIQTAQLKMQQKLNESSRKYDLLYAQFTELEQQGPEVVIRNVRQDPAFAASRRPTALHEQRLRELESLRQAAALH